MSDPQPQDIDDRLLVAHWRRQSHELPSASADEAIRAAARQAMHRRRAWQRFVPLAAAASVGAIAFLLVRQMPGPAPATAPSGESPGTPAIESTIESPIESAVESPEATASPPPAAAETATKRGHQEPQARPERPDARAATAAPALVRAPAIPDAPTMNGAPVPADQPAAADTPLPTDRPAQTAATATGAAPIRERALAAQAMTSERSAPTNGAAELPPALAALVISDAAKRTGISPDGIAIMAVEAVTWSDGALGCRRPGELAIQVLTPGYRVEVDAGGTRLTYHTDTRTQIRYCPRGAIVR